MAVPAWTNAYTTGAAKIDTFTTYRTKLSTGVKTTVLRNHQVGYVRRRDYSNNDIELVKGVTPWRPPSNYRRSISKIVHVPGDFVYNGYHYQGVIFGDTNTERSYLTAYAGYTGVNFDLGQGDLAWLPDERNRAVTECLLKLKEDKVNVGQALAEAKRSANMLADTYSKFAKLLIAAKRRDFRSLKRAFGRNARRSVVGKGVADTYLQWKYGWLPLANDVYGAYQLFQEKIEPPLLLTAVRNISSNHDLSGNTTYYTVDGSLQCNNTCKITARLSDAYLAEANALGLINPLSLGWELVPYSFVVDWVIPIGNVLEALTASAGLTFIGGYEGQRAEAESTAHYKPYSVIGEKNYLKINSFNYRREKLSGFPKPVPYVKSPFSNSNLKSAAALLRQLF